MYPASLGEKRKASQSQPAQHGVFTVIYRKTARESLGKRPQSEWSILISVSIYADAQSGGATA